MDDCRDLKKTAAEEDVHDLGSGLSGRTVGTSKLRTRLYCSNHQTLRLS